MRRFALLLVAALAVVACGSDPEPQAEPPQEELAERIGGFTFGTGECPPEERPSASPQTFDDAPRRCIEDGVDYAAVVTTSEGGLTIDLLEDEAPGTVNNFVVLARWGWFDGAAVHRVVPGYVFQTGDPFETGGPGYSIPDELPASVADYGPGAVAMANRGTPTTGGSQWFVCTDCGGLPGPGYSLFGRVTTGMEVVAAIDALGEGDGPPRKPVTIESVEITEG